MLDTELARRLLLKGNASEDVPCVVHVHARQIYSILTLEERGDEGFKKPRINEFRSLCTSVPQAIGAFKPDEDLLVITMPPGGYDVPEEFADGLLKFANMTCAELRQSTKAADCRKAGTAAAVATRKRANTSEQKPPTASQP